MLTERETEDPEKDGEIQNPIFSTTAAPAEENSNPSPHKPSVVVFKEKLYKLDHRFESKSYAYEYFLLRTQTNTSERNDPYCYEFSIDWSEKYIENHELRTHAAKQDTYKEYIATARDVSEKTETELLELHTDLLKTKIVRKLLDMPSKELIKAREDEHRHYLRDKIQDFYNKIPPALYKWADEGYTSIEFMIVGITERTLTRYGEKKTFSNYPCGDCVTRPHFKDYVYYLLGGLYPRNADEIDSQAWIGSHMADKVRKIYPHFGVEVRPRPHDIFPQIVIHTHISTKDILS